MAQRTTDLSRLHTELQPPCKRNKETHEDQYNPFAHAVVKGKAFGNTRCAGIYANFSFAFGSVHHRHGEEAAELVTPE